MLLTDTEIGFIAEAINDLEAGAKIPAVACAAIKLLLLTGAGKGEVLGLRWSDVDFPRHVLRLRDSKKGAKPVPLAAPALATCPEFRPGSCRRRKGKPHM